MPTHNTAEDTFETPHLSAEKKKYCLMVTLNITFE